MSIQKVLRLSGSLVSIPQATALMKGKMSVWDQIRKSVRLCKADFVNKRRRRRGVEEHYTRRGIFVARSRQLMSCDCGSTA
jgi:hypothetical protein